MWPKRTDKGIELFLERKFLYNVLVCFFSPKFHYWLKCRDINTSVYKKIKIFCKICRSFLPQRRIFFTGIHFCMGIGPKNIGRGLTTMKYSECVAVIVGSFQLISEAGYTHFFVLFCSHLKLSTVIFGYIKHQCENVFGKGWASKGDVFSKGWASKDLEFCIAGQCRANLWPAVPDDSGMRKLDWGSRLPEEPSMPD